MMAQPAPAGTSIFNAAKQGTKLVRESSRHGAPRYAEVVPVKVVPAFASGERAQELQRGKSARAGEQQRVFTIGYEVRFEPGQISAKVARIDEPVIGLRRGLLPSGKL